MKILNVGCGDETYGTDFVDLYPSRPEVIKCDIDKEKLPYKENTFDIVYTKNLLEHLGNPLNALKEMKRVLKKGGKIILITDCAGYWSFHAFYSKFHYADLKEAGHGEEDKHYALFTSFHLKNFFDNVGLKILSIESWNQEAGWFEKPINFFLRLTWLFRRMSYQKLKIEGKKI